MHIYKSIIFFASFTFGAVQSANILGIFPSPSISHQIVFRPLMKALAERGHNILVVTPNPIQVQPNLTSKYEQIDIQDISYETLMTVSDFITDDVSTSSMMKIFNDISSTLGEAQLSSPQVESLINDPKRSFDLCFVENWITSMFAFKDRFNCSLIIISSMIGSFANHEAFGNPTNPILYPDNNSPYVSRMTFWQRLYILYLNVYCRYLYYFINLPKNDDIVKMYFGESTRSVSDIENEADMLFLNGHPLISGIRPSVPNIIYMNSMHINRPKKLPKELESIVNSSINGIIYFSLGSNIKISHISLKKIEAFLEAFKELPYTIIWKWDDEVLPKMPKNVHIMKWLPQQDLLAHSNMQLFIMQAGLQSLEEAIHFSVPLIGIPFYGDQYRNSHTITKYNLGIELDHHKLTKDAIKSAITTIITNPIYRQNIERLSAQIKDEPEKPLERAVWWTEFVLRNKGAGHLRSDSSRYAFYQYFLFDIIAFCVLCFVLIVSIIIFSMKLIYKKIISVVKTKIKETIVDKFPRNISSNQHVFNNHFKMQQLRLALPLVSIYFSVINGANILGLFPIPMVSHQVVFRPLMEALSERGHKVTVVTTDAVDYKGAFPNLRQIDAHNISYQVWNERLNYAKMGQNKRINLGQTILEAFIQLTKVQVELPEVQQLLRDPNASFDLCFIECWIETMLPIKDHFNCSLILISSTTGSLANFDAFGNPSNPVLYVDVLSPYYMDLDFWQRLHQTYAYVMDRYFYYFQQLPQYNAFVKETFGENTRSISKIMNDADMMFLYGHPVLAGVRPIVPGIIYMDNLHISTPKPLPEVRNLVEKLDAPGDRRGNHQTVSSVYYFILHAFTYLNMRHIFAVLLLITSIPSCINGAKILSLFPMPSYSHQVVFRTLMEALAKRGHNITVLTTDPVDYKGTLPNLRQIDSHDISYHLWTTAFNYAKNGEQKAYNIWRKLMNTIMQLTEAQLNLPEMQQLIQDPDASFDICFFLCWVEPILPLKDRFNCSLILISSMTGSMSNFDAFGNPSNPVLSPDLASTYYSDLNFWERLHELYQNAAQRYNYYFNVVSTHDAFTKRMFGNNTRSITEILNDADMLFLNGHPIFFGVRPVVPGIIYMDSLHIKPLKPLPKNLKKILDNSKNKAIYFSLGSNVKSSQLDISRRQAFLQAFRELPFTILWKWEDEFLPDKPDNVYTMKWLPQQDILAHPNVIAFISQGGHQSLEEAIHYNVPVICLPFVIDQKSNAQRIVKHGIGTALSLETLSKDNIKNAIMSVTSDSNYNRNIERLSNLIKDQPETGLSRAIWWTEYVIRNKGAQHLKSPSAKVSFIQYFIIDVIAFVAVCVLLVIFTLNFILKCIRRLFSKKMNIKTKSS
ncbi:uncharacterized protein LOC143921698 [Arctopsyche grandis]|uniref:uncharacterized protein LOC143921698 n=1 Tax=Arctopsyche grandis TaxID=121162 RepID=UPI00406D8F31